MKLSEYMDKYNKTTTELAKLFDTSTGYLHDMKTGRRIPSLEMVLKIQKETDNKVKPEDWITDKSHQERKEAGIKRRLACISAQVSADLA